MLSLIFFMHFNLQFENVWKGESQVVNDNETNYWLVIKTNEMKNGVILGIKYYRAEIYENTSQHLMRLNFFYLTDPNYGF